MFASRTLAALIPTLGLLAPAGAADIPNLKQSEAEADRLDPGWRLADLLARRAKVPPEKNGAPRVLEVFRAIPKEWKDLDPSPGRPAPTGDRSTPQAAWDSYSAAIGDEPARTVPPGVVAALKAQQARIGPLLAKARDLEKVTAGHHPITFGENPLALPLPHVQDSRTVVRLLAFDAQARAAGGDVDGALASARAIFGISRTIGDEPLAISQLVRMAIEMVAVDAIERALARGQASDTALAATQAALADESAQPLLLVGLRGERAVNYDVMDKLASGKFAVKEFNASPFGFPAIAPKEVPALREDQAISLHRFNLAVEIAKKPLPDQPALWDGWDRDMKEVDPAERERHALVYQLMPAITAITQANMRTRAMLRAGETIVGLERVRRAKGRWPKPGESLAPAFKDGLPADPFTGKPMLWKASPTGVLAYSVSYDRADDGGKLEIKDVKRAGTDIGLRLWDADRRPKTARSR